MKKTDALVLEIQVDDNGSPVVKKFKQKIKGLEKETEKSTGKMKTGWGGLWKQMAGGMLVVSGISMAFNQLSSFIRGSIDAYMEQEKADAHLAAVLKSTGNTIGYTIEQLKGMAGALQKQTAYGDEAVEGAQALLLTFTNIGKKVFPDALSIVLDMSTALGQDLKSSAIQVGKALQDPVLGVTALRRVGVNFSKSQMEVIKKLVETGKVAKAQEIIMKELRKEFGGMAKAEVNTLEGKIKQLKAVFGDLQESFIKGLTGATDFQDGIQKITKWMETHQVDVENFGREIGEIINIIKDGIKFLWDFKEAIVGVAAALGTIKFTKFTNNLLISTNMATEGVKNKMSALPGQIGAVAIGWSIGTMLGKGIKKGIDKYAPFINTAIQNYFTMTLGLEAVYHSKMKTIYTERYKIIRQLAKEYGYTGNSVKGMIDTIQKNWGRIKGNIDPLVQKHIERLLNVKKSIYSIKKAEEEKIKQISKQKKAEEERIAMLKAQAKAIEDLGKNYGILTGQTLEKTIATAKTMVLLWKTHKKELKNNSENLEKFTRDVAEMNKILGDKSPKSLQNLNKELDDMNSVELPKSSKSTELWKKTLEVLDTEIKDNVIPEVKGLNFQIDESPEKINKMSKQLGELSEKLYKVADALQDVGDIAEMLGANGETVSKIQEIADGVGKLADGAMDLAAGIAAKNPVQIISGVIKAVSGLLKVIKALSGDGIQEAIDRESSWMNLTKEMQEQIHKLAEEIGDTHAATSKLFADIIEQSEITTENFEQYAKRMHEILSDMDRGTLSASETADALGQAWTEMVEKAKQLFNGKITTEMLNTIRDVKNRGLEVSQITEYIFTQLQEGVKALDTYWKNLGNSQEAYNRGIQYTMSYYNALKAEGKSLTEIMSLMGDSFDEALKKMQEGGYEATGQFKELVELRKKMTGNQGLIDSIEATAKMLETLGNSAYLTSKDFAAFQNDAITQFDKLRKAGFTNKEALQALSPMLENLLWYSEKYGYQLDDQTKKLIEQAQAQGMLSEKTLPYQEKTTMLLEEIVKLLGGDIPYALEKMVGQADKGLNKVISKTEQWRKGLSGISGINFNNNFNNPDIYKNMPRFATGGDFYVDRPTPILVGEAGKERVTIQPIGREKTGGVVIQQDLHFTFSGTKREEADYIVKLIKKAITNNNRGLKDKIVEVVNG